MIIIKRHKILTIFLVLIGFCLFQSPETHAQTLKSNAATENIAIAFYKTGGVIPNFDRWIKDNAPYNLTPWALREKIYKQEMERLQRAYQAFDPKEDYLLVKTSAFLKPLEIGNIENQKTYSLNAEFVKAPDALYFPYDFLEERIILMPYNLENMMQSEITKNQYNFIKRTVFPKSKLTTIVRMKPVESDFSQPHLIDGMEQWVLKTKIASIEFWDDDGVIWEYTAPWYTSPHILEINNLYKDRPKNSSFKKGTIKPTYNKFQ